MTDVGPHVALCEDKLSMGLLDDGGDPLASKEQHTRRKLSVVLLRLVSKAKCCLARVL